MFIIRFLLEQILKLIFVASRSAFMAQTIAIAAAVFGIVPFLNQSGTPSWLDTAMSKAAIIAVVSLIAAIALFVVRWKTWRAPDALDELDAQEAEEARLQADVLTLEDLPALTRSRSEQPAEPFLVPWVPLLAFSLVAIPAIAFFRSKELIALWADIIQLIDRLDLIKGLTAGGGQMSGVVFAPVFVVLYVPLLEAAAAFFLIVVPLLLLMLFLTRSRNFPRAMVMMVICQTGLVLMSAIAAAIFAQLATEGMPALLKSGDPEGQQVADQLVRMQQVVLSTARGFFVPLLAYCAWIPAMFTSRRIEEFFSAGSEVPREPQPDPSI
jgi:hypothetical protein